MRQHIANVRGIFQHGQQAARLIVHGNKFVLHHLYLPRTLAVIAAPAVPLP